MTGSGRPGVLLMTYGSPASLDRDDVRAYLARVRRGRDPEPDLVDEFTRRYRAIGGSPLVENTRAQATALADALGWPIEVGMQFSEPSISAGLRRLAEAGVDRVAGVILSPQYSPLLMGGYARAVDTARTDMGGRAPEVVIAGAWHDDPAFVRALASRVEAALARLSATERRSLTVLMTAHSLPRRVAEEETAYLDQLHGTAEAVARQAGIPDGQWAFCWQSAGHEPGEWMKPDFTDLLPEAARAGKRAVLVVPIQFLSDHLETLYDVDIGAREQADAHGLAFERIASLNVEPNLIEALANAARRALLTRPVVSRAS